jgi:uncharacterized protein
VIERGAGPPKIDVHVHLAGVGTQGSGCWTSPGFRRRLSFRALRLVFRITDRQMRTTVDQDWPAMISELVERSDLDLAVVLGFDGVYDRSGTLDHERSQMIIPQRWVFECCRRYGNLLPGPSINPYRSDAMERLEEAIEDGAALIKWLPIVQGFDPADARALRFGRRAADAGIPLLIHAGSGEVTFRTVDPTVGEISRIIPLLENGVKVICAHTAAPIHYTFERSELPLLFRLLDQFPNLFVDNSGIANPSRWMHLPRFASDSRVAARTLHGSDFPVLPVASLYARRLGLPRTLRIEREPNPLQKEVRIKRAVGFTEDSFTRAASVLANVDRWHRPAPAS